MRYIRYHDHEIKIEIIIKVTPSSIPDELSISFHAFSTRFSLNPTFDLSKRQGYFLISMESCSSSLISVISKNCLGMFKKQPPEVFYKKRCSQKSRKIHRKTPVPVSFLTKLQPSGEICEIFKNIFLQNTSGRLLLDRLVKTRLKFAFSTYSLIKLSHPKNLSKFAQSELR